jgi:hypothetical protein
VTVAISLKVNDGIVLAADSASTLVTKTPDGREAVANVYNNANKVFNLLKGSPIGMITWGSGAIGNASISTLAKDLRRRFAGLDSTHSDWKIDTEHYTVEGVATRVCEFMYDEQYKPAFDDWQQKPALGFMVAGYSSGETMAEEYQITMTEDGRCDGPKSLRQKNESGVTWNGQTEAISRLVLGFSPRLATVLEARLGVPQEQVPPAIDILRQALAAPLVMPPMPIQDAIDLAEFLVDVTIKFTRFSPGLNVIGGPIEVAAITKHEGFKWVHRKFYYTSTLNPEE